MADLTPAAASMFDHASDLADEIEGYETIALVRAIQALALEVAALRKTIVDCAPRSEVIDL